MVRPILPRPLRIVVPGGSGQIGHVLAEHFQQRGHHVTVLTRSPFAAQWETVHWDGTTIGPWAETLEGADVCINLAGRSVNCRYTRENCADIYNSRIGTTRLLGSVLSSLNDPPWLWLNASTATIYRHAPIELVNAPMDELTGELGGDELLTRARRVPKSWNFSVQVARDWEAEFFRACTPRTRKVAMRSAITMSPVPGSAFGVLSRLVRAGLGGPQGNGRQFVSWIHELDFARAVEFLIACEELEGVINIAAPNPLPNREFMSTLRDAWDVPNGLPAPTFALEIGALLLRTETELVLKSRRVVPRRLIEAGFEFDFPSWPDAADDLVHDWRRLR